MKDWLLSCLTVILCLYEFSIFIILDSTLVHSNGFESK